MSREVPISTIRRGRNFRPLVTRWPRPLPRPSPAESAVAPRDQRPSLPAHLPCFRPGGAERAHTSGRLQGARGSPGVPRGRGGAGRLSPVRLCAEGGRRCGAGLPEATVETRVSRSPCPSPAPSFPGAAPAPRSSPRGRSVPAAGAWPLASGPPSADWRRAQATPRGARPRSREAR